MKMSKYELKLVTPRNYKELNKKQQDIYLDLKDKKMLNRTGTVYLNQIKNCFVIGNIGISCSTNHKI